MTDQRIAELRELLAEWKAYPDPSPHDTNATYHAGVRDGHRACAKKLQTYLPELLDEVERSTASKQPMTEQEIERALRLCEPVPNRPCVPAEPAGELREAIQSIVNKWDNDKKNPYRARAIILELKAALQRERQGEAQ